MTGRPPVDPTETDEGAPAIRIRGARQHNLKGLDLDIPTGTLVAITGVSGSGKSSLAFDTLFAEGQRRYVESFSTYARQFLDRMDKPQVDEIAGIPPAIAIDQSNPVKNSRSTVGTMTEINDYVKVLYANLATLHCRDCGEPVVEEEPTLVARRYESAGGRALVSFPLQLTRKMTAEEMAGELAAAGFRRFVDSAGTVSELDLEALAAERIDVVVDRLRLRERDRARLVDSLEQAFRYGKGRASLWLENGDGFSEQRLSTARHCARCDVDYARAVPNLFSFNSPLGACPACKGFGRTIGVDLGLVVPEPGRTLGEGAIKPWQTKSYADGQSDLMEFCRRRRISVDTPWRELPESHRRAVVEGDHGFYGIQGFFEWLEGRTYKMHIRVLLSRYRSYRECESCRGSRFQPDTLLYRLGDLTLPELYALDVDAALDFARGLPRADGDRVAALLLGEIESRLSYLSRVGLSYLTLDRQSRTLSGGEMQRVDLTTALGSSLVGALYVLDEPSIGLHPRDTERLMDILRRLRDGDNTVVVVEHDADVIRRSDHVLDLGPGAGEAGGDVLYFGPTAGLVAAEASRTGRYLGGAEEIPRRPERREIEHGRALRIRGARAHNLKAIDVRLPLGGLVAVTGVSGSGKSSLVEDVLHAGYRRLVQAGEMEPGLADAIEGVEHVDEIVLVDQSPVGRTPRANPITYLKCYDSIRRAFARSPDAVARGFTASTFSFNVEGGRCPTCSGEGFERVEMQFLSDVYVPCESCGGSRFVREVLEVRYRGRTIRDVLSMTASEARSWFGDDPKIADPLAALERLGLGYLRLGQPLNTLSGGEAQRLKLVARIAQASPERTLFLFDEPTTGLHFEDVRRLLEAFDELLERGASLLVVEHNLDVLKNADWIVDLGPEGGDDGGRVIAAGTPEDIVATDGSHTGRYLAPYLGGPARTAAITAPLERGAGAGDAIQVRGARHHNLKALDVDVPRDALVVVTGVSGSGKSSLAFDILFAEGQRRFLESLSAYARQYIRVLDKPEVDVVRGMPPAIAIEQRLTRGGRSSTVATVTEVYHYLRLLYAKLGTQHCVECDLPITPQSEDQIVADIEDRFAEREIAIYAPLVRARKGAHREVLARARKEGYEALRIDGETVPASKVRPLARYVEHDIEALVATGLPSRSSISRALTTGGGALLVVAEETPRYYDQSRACPRCERSYEEPDPRVFSFNSRYGSCPTCSGAGRLESFDEQLLVPDDGESLDGGALAVFPRAKSSFPRLPRERARKLARRHGVDPAKPFRRASSTRRRAFLADLVEALEETLSEASPDLRDHLASFRTATTCADCSGARIHATARAVRLHGRGIHEIASGTPGALLDFTAALRTELLPTSARARALAEPLLHEIDARLALLEKVGLGYLQLDRSADTLSGGEAQRVRLAAQLGSKLRGVCYVLDEPTIGLHARDHGRLLETLRELASAGNSVVVVEHDEETIRGADHVIDLGPGGGTEGGYVVATGTPEAIAANPSSVTGRFLARRTRGERRPRPLRGQPAIEVKGARAHNLRGVDVSFPLERLTVVTGVSGSGKSTLVRDVLERAVRRALGGVAAPGAHERIEGVDAIDRVLEVDQTPIGKTPRSIPASYVGFYDEIRKLFAATTEARVAGYSPGRFSFNVRGGRCETCKGQGSLRMEMSFLPNVEVRCEDCDQKRFNAETLAVTYRGKNVNEVLEMTVSEAESFFTAVESIRRPIELLNAIGLGYLKLGQPSNTLSGGEAQRIKLAHELSKSRRGSTLYVLDEPTTGLHFADITRLLDVLHALVDAGHTVVVIEHNLDVISQADCVVDLGPEGGSGGGEVVFRGTPRALARRRRSHTGRHLQAWLDGREARDGAEP